MTASIDHLHSVKPEVVADDQALSRVTPASHAHVNSLGRYTSTDNPRRPADSGRCAEVTRTTERSRRHRWA